MRHSYLTLSSPIVLFLACLSAAGQQPEMARARVDQSPASGGLPAAIASATRGDSGPSWIGYSLPAAPESGRNGRRTHGWNSCTADLEEGMNITGGTDSSERPTPRRILVFLRVRGQQVEKIRMFDENCRINADDMIVHWLTSVVPAQSVALLRGYIENPSADDRGGALAAIASTDDPSADDAMQHFTSSSSPTKLRKDSVFWLGAARGQKGYQMLRTIVKNDESDEVRDQAVFALSISPAPEAVDTLIDVARHDPNSHLRGQALFWLANIAGARAAGTISSAVENDPDTQVKKRAVFALSQLPPDQGIPLLIKTAQTNTNPEVRKQAFFWLGQSHDPRALDFITQVLTN